MLLKGKTSCLLMRVRSRASASLHPCNSLTASLSTSSTSQHRYDTIIVGGGPVGSSTALHLAMQGHRNVLVLEKDPSYRLASSMRSAGGIRQQFSVEENIRMSTYGINFLKSIPEKLAITDKYGEKSEVPDVQFHETGYLFLGSNEKILLENNQKQRDCGVDWMQTLSAKELAAKFPWLNTEGVAIGSYGTKNEGYFDPWSFVAAMKNKAISMGVTYAKGEVVDAKVSIDSNGKYYIDKVYAVSDRNTTEYSGGHIVNAAGAWTSKLISALAAASKQSAAAGKAIHELPIKARKRCIFNIHCPGSNADLVVPGRNTPLTIDPTGVYFRPEGLNGNKFICGVSPEEAQDIDCLCDEDMDVVDHRLFEEVIWPVLYERVPAFQELKVVGSWAGFYEYNTVDQNAIIGRHPDFSNLLLCTGFSGHGLQQSPAAGRAVSELIVDGKFTTIDLKRFSFERIINNEPVFETGIV